MIKRATINDLDIINNFLKEFNNVTINEEQLINHPYSHYAICINDEKIVGFLNYALIYDKVELNYIYVSNEDRHFGYAKEMMDYLIKTSINNKCLNITLEVAKDNSAAIKLYERYGFNTISIRKNYYKDQDGLLMERKLVIK